MSTTIWRRLLFFTLGVGACVIGYLFLLGVPGLSRTSPTSGVIPALVLALAVFWLNARFLRADGLSLTEIGCEFSALRTAQFSYGFLGGGLLVGGWVGIVVAATGAQWHLNITFNAVALVSGCAFAFFNNAAEELVYRGYAFVRIADYLHPAVAVVATSSVFALLHLQGGVPLLNVIAGVLTCGLIFGVLFARWRSLPLALGFHLATNVFQDASGIRLSGASLVAPTYPSVAADPVSVQLALAATATLNLAVAVVLALYPRKWKSSNPYGAALPAAEPDGTAGGG